MNQSIEFLKTIRTLSEQDLTKKMTDSKIRLQKLSFSHKVTPLENPKLLKALRKDIARMNTVLNNQN